MQELQRFDSMSYLTQPPVPFAVLNAVTHKAIETALVDEQTDRVRLEGDAFGFSVSTQNSKAVTTTLTPCAPPASASSWAAFIRHHGHRGPVLRPRADGGDGRRPVALVWRSASRSADENNCAAVSKYQNLQQPFTDAVHRANQLGIQTVALIMLGLPHDTPDQLESTLEYLKHVPCSDYDMRILRIYPSTPLYRQMLATGDVTENWWLETESLSYLQPTASEQPEHAFPAWPVPSDATPASVAAVHRRVERDGIGRCLSDLAGGPSRPCHGVRHARSHRPSALRQASAEAASPGGAGHVGERQAGALATLPTGAGGLICGCPFNWLPRSPARDHQTTNQGPPSGCN